MAKNNDTESNIEVLSISRKEGPLLQGGCLSSGFWTGSTSASWRNHSTSCLFNF